MTPGDVVKMTHCEAVDGRNRFGFKAVRGNRFVFVMLGVESDAQPLEPEAALNALGWFRNAETEKAP